MDTGIIVPVALLVVLSLIYAITGLRIIKEHEQGVIMRFGRFHLVVPAGLALIVPFVDVLRRVDLRTLVVEERIDAPAGTGKVRLWGELWPARSLSGEAIGPGTPIQIAAIEGRQIVVDRAANGSTS